MIGKILCAGENQFGNPCRRSPVTGSVFCGFHDEDCRCAGTTQRGTPCTRMPPPGAAFCVHHSATDAPLVEPAPMKKWRRCTWKKPNGDPCDSYVRGGTTVCGERHLGLPYPPPNLDLLVWKRVAKCIGKASLGRPCPGLPLDGTDRCKKHADVDMDITTPLLNLPPEQEDLMAWIEDEHWKSSPACRDAAVRTERCEHGAVRRICRRCSQVIAAVGPADDPCLQDMRVRGVYPATSTLVAAAVA